ncbi:hypothetical protein AVEN_227478-1 [Araneus ventricosus]|uniref:Uncharacterized protein n=1 Tax=Araneus ventricosus TaxID=182803 RepID=A0A4Y2C6K9_ARAVE|nr:hypothetical protein AVEN_227478-1 [Araneus ventricosus]
MVILNRDQMSGMTLQLALSSPNFRTTPAGGHLTPYNPPAPKPGSLPLGHRGEVLKGTHRLPTRQLAGPPRYPLKAIGEKGADAGKAPFQITSFGGFSFETRRRLTSSGHTSSQENALRTPRANAIEESKTEFCHWEKRTPLRQMKKAEFVTPPRRAGSKGLLKRELERDWGEDRESKLGFVWRTGD